MLISIIIPTKNEPAVETLISKINEIMKSLNMDYNILAVDKSADDTRDRLRTLGIEILEQKSKGLGGAIVEGLKASRGDLVFVMDADLSHDPKFIPSFIEKSKEGLDVVVGSRRIEGGKVIGWGLYRKIVSRVANSIGRIGSGLKISDITSGYRLYRKTVIESLDFQDFKTSGYAFQLEVLSKALNMGFRIGEVPIVFSDRAEGKSKLSKKDIFEFLLTSVRLGFRRFVKILS
ncbi:MAG: polyprenol monophosphomannose synthase [Candidatus Bathyarchaeia archaeon]